MSMLSVMRYTLTATQYLGTCWETLQKPDGSVELTKMHLYHINGERRFALTEEDARRVVDAALAAKS